MYTTNQSSKSVVQTVLTQKIIKDEFFKRVKFKSQEAIKLIHTDVCGPIKLSSLGKNNYLLILIGDFSIKTWFIS